MMSQAREEREGKQGRKEKLHSSEAAVTLLHVDI